MHSLNIITYMFTQAKLKEKQRKKKEAESMGEEVLQLI